VTDYKQLTAHAFVRHWEQQLEDGQPISLPQQKLAEQLRSHGYQLSLDTSVGQTSTQTSRQSEPGGKGKTHMEGISIYKYQWREAIPQFKAWLLAELNPIDGMYQLGDETAEVYTCSLDWYEDYRLVRLYDPGWENPKLRLYYLIGQGADLHRLNGASPPIHEVNAKAPIKLNKDNVLSYLIFFCFFVRSEEGPFYVLESMDDPVVEEFKEMPLGERLRATTLEVIEGTVRPATLVGVNADGHYHCDGIVAYSNALFRSNFSVLPTGMVEMLDDEPIAADMPFRVDAPIA
jgi:hypothetical protein